MSQTATLPRSTIAPLSAPSTNGADPPADVAPPTAATTASAICDLHVNAELCLERLQLLLDSVADAVIQTQDMSALAQTWSDKTVEGLTATSILFDAVLLVATDGLTSVISTALSGVVQDTLTKLYNHNEIFAQLTAAAAGATASGATGAKLSSDDELPQIGDSFGPWSRGIRKAGEQGFTKLGQALASAAKGGSHKRTATVTNGLPPTRSPVRSKIRFGSPVWHYVRKSARFRTPSNLVPSQRATPPT